MLTIETKNELFYVESEGSDDDDDEEDKRDLEGKTYTKAGNEVTCMFYF